MEVSCRNGGFVCQTRSVPSCFRRGTGRDRDPRRWSKRGTISDAILSPQECSALRWAEMYVVLKFNVSLWGGGGGGGGELLSDYKLLF